MDSDHRLSLSVFFAELGLNLDNLAEVQEKVLQLQDSIIARDEILEEATAELNDLREKALNNTKVRCASVWGRGQKHVVEGRGWTSRFVARCNRNFVLEIDL